MNKTSHGKPVKHKIALFTGLSVAALVVGLQQNVGVAHASENLGGQPELDTLTVASNREEVATTDAANEEVDVASGDSVALSPEMASTDAATSNNTQATSDADTTAVVNAETEIAPHGPLPSEAQLNYHKEELAAFIHFGMNTFTNKEWGNGEESPTAFNPTDLDAEQWITVLKDAGFKRTILVVKHHDGFVLYPSKHTEHDVEASPWKNGQGDVLLEVSKAATKHNMDLGVYLSPWDANHPKYHVNTEAEYNEYYLNQLKEILGDDRYGNNGKFVEVWMDGARGEGAQKVTYTFDKWFDYIREAEGDITIFSAEPTSVRWIGNERGIAGDPVWHKVRRERITGKVSHAYLNNGDPEGDMYSVGEADVSIRPGWFYHENQQPKSLRDLMNIYFKSVGRGTPLLLNIPPDKRGKFADADVARLREFRETLDSMYAVNHAEGATVTASSTRQNAKYNVAHLTDGKDDTSWAPANDALTATFTVDLGEAKRFDVVELKEDIALGQRISDFNIEVELNGKWVRYGEGATVGYRRLIQGRPVTASKIRVNITGSQATPILTNFAVYKTPASIEQTDGYPLGLEYHSNTTANKNGTTWHAENEGVRGTSMWTNRQGASAEYTFEGTKAYVVSTIDPNHDVMEIYVDGVKVQEVNTRSTVRKRSQMVFETDTLSKGRHTIKLVNKTNRAIAAEGIYVLNNNGEGMFEIAEPVYNVQKGRPAEIRIKRVGGHEVPASVKVITEPGTGVHGKVYQDTTINVQFAAGEMEKVVSIPTLDFTEQPNQVFDFKVKLTESSGDTLIGFVGEATVRVMKSALLPQNMSEIDDQAAGIIYRGGWQQPNNASDKFNNTESWMTFNRATAEAKRDISVTIYFEGTGIEMVGHVDPTHGIYEVELDGQVVEYQEGLGNSSEVDGKRYFSGTAATRRGDQSLVKLSDLQPGIHSLTVRLDSQRNNTNSNTAIQVDKFVISGENARLVTQADMLAPYREYMNLLSTAETNRLKPEALQTYQAQLAAVRQQFDSNNPSIAVMSNALLTVAELLDNENSYVAPGTSDNDGGTTTPDTPTPPTDGGTTTPDAPTPPTDGGTTTPDTPTPPTDGGTTTPDTPTPPTDSGTTTPDTPGDDDTAEQPKVLAFKDEQTGIKVTFSADEPHTIHGLHAQKVTTPLASEPPVLKGREY
ncbi:alpha-L-fucosidase, partial [Aerococcaceae bacterium NML201296]|nr:alpha-L-fucosidase [Aerococcaceae bacterium NML201296]